MPGKGPKPACVEEWDSDESCAKPATEVQAKQNSSTARRHEQQKTPSRTPKQAQPTSRQEPASDSGYSSQNSAARAKGVPPSLSIPPTNATRQPASTPMSPTKPNTKKPVIHRVDSGRSRSQTVVQQASDKCDDPNCRDANCPSRRNKERRQTINYSQAQSPSSPSQAYTYAQAPQYQYSKDMPPPPLPLQRTNSRSGRPQSYYAGMPMPYQGAQPGPPPAQSPYYSYAQGYGQPPVYGVTATGQQMYVPASPIPPSPTSPNASGYPGYSGGTISARIPNPNVAGIEVPKVAQHPSLAIRTSARRPDNRALPGAYPDDAETSDSSASSSEYDSEEERYQRRREAEAKQRRRLSYVEPRSKSRPRDKSLGRDATIAMITQSSHARRPSMSKSYHTDSYVPTRRHSVRDPRTERLQRAPYSDNGFDYPSSDNFDSDRTARAVVSTRSIPSSKQHSRRQSVSTNASTNASSGGTKATTLSSGTDYSYAIIEDSRSRRKVYLSKEQQAELIRQHERQRRRDSIDERERFAASPQYNAASAYQKKMSGGIDSYEMSAENIKNLNRKSTSHSHSGRSQKSAGSGSKVSRSNGGVKIHAGGTVLHVDGDMAMQVRTTDDGEVHLVLGQNGREIEYNNSSKGSSRSRISRGRGRDRIPEAVDEGGYEKPL